jgi:hypothetical protein
MPDIATIHLIPPVGGKGCVLGCSQGVALTTLTLK